MFFIWIISRWNIQICICSYLLLIYIVSEPVFESSEEHEVVDSPEWLQFSSRASPGFVPIHGLVVERITGVIYSVHKGCIGFSEDDSKKDLHLFRLIKSEKGEYQIVTKGSQGEDLFLVTLNEILYLIPEEVICMSSEPRARFHLSFRVNQHNIITDKYGGKLYFSRFLGLRVEGSNIPRSSQESYLTVFGHSEQELFISKSDYFSMNPRQFMSTEEIMAFYYPSPNGEPLLDDPRDAQQQNNFTGALEGPRRFIKSLNALRLRPLQILSLILFLLVALITLIRNYKFSS